MPVPTNDRIALNTAPRINARFEQQLRDNVSALAHDPGQIPRRLEELDREWDIERIIELESPAMIGIGLALGTLHDRRWYALSALAASMVLVHSVRGWYPLLPLLRRLGVRSASEIERERNALRALRGEVDQSPAAPLH